MRPALLVLAAAALATPAAGAEPLWRGQYAEARDGTAWIVPCRLGKRLELVDSEAARELRALFKQLGAGRARSIFVEVEGEREGDLFRVAAVRRAQFGAAGCSEDLRRVVAKAGGQNPAWSIVFDDARLAFHRVGDPQPAAFPPLGSFAERDGRREFAAETEAARIKLVLVRERCEDRFANAVLPYRAEVTFAWAGGGEPRTYRGCGYLGDAAR
jgi:uncharacterized membrane protein